MNSEFDRQVIAAHFSSPEAATNSIQQLRAAGFGSHQIGTSFEGGDFEGRSFDEKKYGADYETHHRSFMDKVKSFFTGEEGYEDRDTGSGDGIREEGVRVGPTLSIPQRYQDRLVGGGTIVTVYAADRGDEAERILTEAGGSVDREFLQDSLGGQESNDGGVGTGIDQRSEVADEGRRISLLSEVLHVNKERVQSGEVRLRKEVKTENQTIEVPVTREELVIERVASGERNTSGEQIGDNQEIRVPLSEDRVNVEKTPVVREEVRAVKDTQTISEDLRREELDVEDSTGRVRDNENVVKGKNKKIA